MNHVTIDGTITNDIWTYSGDTLFRLRHGDNSSAFFTIRFQNLPLDVKPGQRVVITGTLTSREQRVNLEDFVGRATPDEGEVDQKLVEKLNEQLQPVNRSYTEIIANEVRKLG